MRQVQLSSSLLAIVTSVLKSAANWLGAGGTRLPAQALLL